MIDEEMAEEYAEKECCATCKKINHSSKGDRRKCLEYFLIIRVVNIL